MDTRNNEEALAVALAQKVAAAGGTAYYVGGCVRDRLRGAPGKDIDIEVHGLAPRALEAILDSLGERLSIGESFGIYSLRHHELDIAMPRKEKPTGRGHRDFDVTVDPFIGTEKAASRRDFTVNAMMQNVLTGEIVDHFGGRTDLAAGILRHVNDDTFTEDPLRVLRAAQFAARFRFAVAPETLALCGRLELAALPRERVEGELNKALLKAAAPSVFFEVLHACGQLGVWFPEPAALIGVPDGPSAGEDVWAHTMRTLDEAAALRAHANAPRDLMLAALTHDFGKALPGDAPHETAGLAPAAAFLDRLSDDKKRRRYVLGMTALHMEPLALARANAPARATNAMFDSAEDPGDLVLLREADDRGRSAPLPAAYATFLRDRLRLYSETAVQPAVTGADLIRAGLKPDRDFAGLLAYARELLLSGVKKEEALAMTLARARGTGREN